MGISYLVSYYLRVMFCLRFFLIYILSYPRVRFLYQDVGVVEAISGDLDFKNYPIGSVIQLLPWHVSIARSNRV